MDFASRLTFYSMTYICPHMKNSCRQICSKTQFNFQILATINIQMQVLRQFFTFRLTSTTVRNWKQLKFTLFCRYGPLTGFIIQIQQLTIVRTMMQRQYLVMLLLALIVRAQAPISLDFNAFDASYSQDQKLRLSFRCTGGSGAYTFEFRNIPAEWKVSGNTITIQRFSINTRQNWRFSIYVTDTQNNYLSQNLMLNFMGAYIGLTSITLPVTGRLAPPPVDDFASSPFSIASQLSQLNQQPQQPNRPFTPTTQPPNPQPTQPTAPQTPQTNTNTQPARLGDLVNGYPGADPVDKLTTGFGVPTDSPLTADLIASSKAVYNPLRDSASAPSPYKDQKDLAVKRQSQANQTIQGLNSFISRLSATLDKLQADAKVAELDTNNSRLSVNECDQQLYGLEDTKSKILNAIKDKESTLNQYNNQISKQDKIIENQVQKLNSLEDLKKKTESDTLPSSRALQNLQRTLDQCKSGLIKNSKQSQQIKMDLEKTQTEMKMLNIESNEAKAKAQQLNSDLGSVREKIKSLTDQLKEAQNYEKTIISDKAKYEEIPAKNDRRVAQLQARLNNITSSSTSVKNSEDCKVYEAPIITVQNIISKDRERYNQVLAQVQNQKAVVEKAKNSSSELKKIVSSLPLQINTLKNQASTYDVSINRTTYFCDDKITEYSKNAVSLQSINEKIDSSKNDLAGLNFQLQSAQSQLTAATNALNDILKNQASYLSRLPISSLASGAQSSSSSRTPASTSGSTSASSSSSSSTSFPSTSSSSFASSGTGSSATSTSTSSRNPNISIDEIINSVINKKTTSASASVSTPPGSTGSVSVQTTTSQRPQQTINSASASSSSDNSQFSIASFLSKSTDPVLTTTSTTGTVRAAPANRVAASASSNPAPTSTSTSASISSASSLSASTGRNPLNQNFDTVIGQQFKALSKSGFKSVFVQDLKAFLKKSNINLGNVNLNQNQYLNTLDAVSLRSLTYRGNTQATLPLLSCSTPSLSDTAVIQDIGLGYILARNSDTLFRLTFTDCTKIASTATSGSLKQGTRIYFTGIPVVSIPNNVLLNANLVVCIPEAV